MKETKPAAANPSAELDSLADAGTQSEIRLLDDLELVLAGGGESDANWP